MIIGHICRDYTIDYFINDKGWIGSTTDESQLSYDWKVKCAIRYNNFGRVVEYKSFSQLKELNGKWLHKNGKQKWHLCDIDHGTDRTWMSPNHYVFIN